MTLGSITGDFADRVGGDGFSDIKRARTCCGKSIWISLFVFVWTIVCCQVYMHITTYLLYPIDTKVTLQFDDAAIFPVVSFCNLNPVKWGKLNRPDAQLPESLQEILKPEHKAGDSLEHLMRQSWGEETEYDGLVHPPPPEYEYDEEDFKLDWSPEDHPEEIQIRNEFYNYYWALPDRKKKGMGHQLDDMLTECIWQEKQCYPSNFTHYLHPKYGNCYAFNAGWVSETKKNRTILKSHLPGPSDGLSMTLFVEAEEYVPLIADSTGVRVHIHSQDSPPHPEDTGFTISAGFASALEIRKVELNRLPSPYNSADCRTWFDHYYNDIRAFWPRANYSTTTCMKLCFQENLLAYCGCIDSSSYYLNNSRGSEGPCSISNATQGLCYQKFAVKYRMGLLSKLCESYCPQSCSEKTYEVQYSSAVWPNEYYENILTETMAPRSGHLQERKKKLMGGPGLPPPPEEDKSYVGDNMLKVNVYYQSLNYKMISEEAAYVLVDMLADLGGAADLWVGMSVLAMVQVIEYVIEILVYVCCRASPTKIHANTQKPAPEIQKSTNPNYPDEVYDTYYDVNPMDPKDYDSYNQGMMYEHGSNDFSRNPPLTISG